MTQMTSILDHPVKATAVITGERFVTATGAVAAAAAGKLAHNKPDRVRHALAEEKE